MSCFLASAAGQAHRALQWISLASKRELSYIRSMQPASKTRTHLVPGAVPFNEAEQAEWDALSDEERFALFNEMLASPDCNSYVDETMDEILAANKARMKSRHGQIPPDAARASGLG